MPFCAQCGSAVGAVKFCSKCGARVPEAAGTAAAPPASSSCSASSSAGHARPNPPVAQPAAQGGNVLMKVLVGFLVFILLIVLAVMGSCVYIGYRAKKKADEIQQAYKSNDLNKLAGALGVGNSPGGFGFLSRTSSGTAGGDSAAHRSPLSFPAWTPSAAGAESGTKVPLRPGLTVVTAIAQFGGDYESIKQIQQVSPVRGAAFLPCRQCSQSAGGSAETERRHGAEIQRVHLRSADSSHRRPAKRPRLHAVVWPQPAGTHAGNDSDQRFPGSSG